MLGESFPKIHPTALIDPSAELAPDVEIGPYSCVGPRVRIGVGTRVASHCVIASDTQIGERNRILHHVVLGTDSQDMKFKGETSGLIIGDDNVFREFITVNRATGERSATLIGDNNLLLAYTHVAHNCVLGNHIVLANSTQMAGEVVLEDHVTTGGLVGIHQFCRVGAHAFVGACSKVTQDILPYVTADGHPARPHGLNLIGLKRSGFSDDSIAIIKIAYRAVFLKSLTLEEAIAELLKLESDHAEIHRIVEFSSLSSDRGLARPRGYHIEQDEDV